MADAQGLLLNATPLGSVNAAAGLYNKFQRQAPTAQAGSEGLQDLATQQASQARAFRSNLPGYQSQAQAGFEDQARANVAGGTQDVTRSSNQRGLLYSGLRQGGQAAVGAQAANQLANQTAGFNQYANQVANQMDAQAIGTGLMAQQQQQQANDFNYNQALNLYNQRSQALGGLGGVLGQVGGRALS